MPKPVSRKVSAQQSVQNLEERSGSAASTTAAARLSESLHLHSKAYGTLAASLADLKQRLAEQKATHDERARVARSDYEARLHEKQVEIANATRENADLSSAIGQLDTSERQLRGKASELTDQKNSLQADLLKMEKTLGTAAEFASLSIKRVEDVDSDPDFAVLDELYHQDESRKSAEEKLSRLTEVAQAGAEENLALLEISSSVPFKSSGEAGSLLKQMHSNLDIYDSEAESSEEKLKEAYLAEVAAADKQLVSLRARHQELEAQKNKLAERNQRLEKAVSFLQTTCEDLSKHKKALQRFAAKLGAKED